MLAILFVLGNWRAGVMLSKQDAATSPAVRISGVVARKVSENRVYLEDVTVDDGTVITQPAVVTLMADKDENGNVIEPLRPVQIGQRISGTGRLFEPETPRNPGDIDWRIRVLCDGYGTSGYLLQDWIAEGEGKFSLLEWLRQLKVMLSERIERCFGENAPFFQAILIGDKAQMEDAITQAMRLAGVVHLLTISGVHLSMIARVLGWAVKRLPAPKAFTLILEGLLLAGYTLMTGGAPGTVRALIMAMLREVSKATGRRYDPLSALSAAALLMTLFNPIWALNASFQFSFLVVLGILLLSRQFADAIRRGREENAVYARVAGAAALSGAAQLSALPMQLALYGYIPLLALPMNLFAGTLMPLLMIGGWGTISLYFIHKGFAECLASWVGRASMLLGAACMRAAEVPWGIIRLPAVPMAAVGVFAVLLMMVSRQIKGIKNRRAFCGGLAMLMLLLYVPRFDPSPQYVQLDVGQGDAAVVRNGREAVLIDVGPEDAYAALRYLRHEGLRVSLVVFSHLDQDHAGALGTLLDSEIEIERIAMAKRADEDVEDEKVLHLLRRAREAGVTFETYEQGDAFEAADCRFSVLSPHDALSGGNERSLVLFAQIGDMALLTLGDLPEDCEPEQLPACDILKVAHHGSRYATSRQLIEQVQPEIAIISVGSNPYGHPTDRVLEDLHEAGAQVYRTDTSGAVTVRCKGEEISAETYLR